MSLFPTALTINMKSPQADCNVSNDNASLWQNVGWSGRSERNGQSATERNGDDGEDLRRVRRRGPLQPLRSPVLRLVQGLLPAQRRQRRVQRISVRRRRRLRHQRRHPQVPSLGNVSPNSVKLTVLSGHNEPGRKEMRRNSSKSVKRTKIVSVLNRKIDFLFRPQNRTQPIKAYQNRWQADVPTWKSLLAKVSSSVTTQTASSLSSPKTELSHAPVNCKGDPITGLWEVDQLKSANESCFVTGNLSFHFSPSKLGKIHWWRQWSGDIATPRALTRIYNTA